MSCCKYCGDLIDWIQLPSGKWVAVEYRPVVVMPGRGTETFITNMGEWIEGKQTLAGPVAGNLVAFIPHRRRCSGQYEKGER